MNKKTLYKIPEYLGLGELVEAPSRVYGGFLHISYKLHTTKGTFMIKCFDKVKNEEEAIQKFRVMDEREDRLIKEKISAVYPIRFFGHGVQILDKEAFYVFPWLEDWKAIKGENSTFKQCKKMAKVTAKIHKIHTYVCEKTKPEKLEIDWKDYLKQLKSVQPEIYSLIKENLSMLGELTRKTSQYSSKIPNVIAFCHNDMDCKNVLWKGNKYKLIDLEKLGFGNAYLELFKHALVWSGYEESNINFDRYRYFFKVYFKHSKLDKNIDFEGLYYGSALGLKWLEFNIKRVLGLAGKGEEERQLGFDQCVLTISQIKHFYLNKDKIVNVKL